MGNKRLTVIVDSDAFVALLHNADVHGQAAERILTALSATKPVSSTPPP